jgi:hypothetical protein
MPVPVERRVTGFNVYFGVFDKSQLEEVTRQVLYADLGHDEDLEQEERGALEGLTCMARLKVGQTGEPLLAEVSVSTAPWALGRIQSGGLASLDFDAFHAGIEGLKESLRQFRAVGAPDSTTTATDLDKRDAADSARIPGPAPLSGSELLALQRIFEEWTGFCPEHRYADAPAIVVEVRTVEKKPEKAGANPLVDTPSAGVDDETGEDDDGSVSDVVEIDILNSFFAQDIARAIASLERGEHGGVLRAYLAPLPSGRRVDLYDTPGRAEILRMLSPAKLPAAHWLDEPGHAMSLMQQFAINSIFDRLQSGGVFSVNGPPGTGKTTLLRDVFAELITRRARILAGLARAGDAFEGAVTVDFQDQRCCHVGRLRADLTGFEMVVASSNNAAVENLSRDLPKAKALGKAGKSPWRDGAGGARIGYLKPVAANIAARTAKGGYTRPNADDMPWGLIACALGNKDNRSTFSYRLGADARGQKGVKNFDPRLHQSLWTWRGQYEGPGFAEARIAFQAADDAVRQRLMLLDRHAVLCTVLRGHTQDSFCADAAAALAQAMQAVEVARVALADLERERALCASQLASLREEARLIEQDRPVWWLRWILRTRERMAAAELAENRRMQRDWLMRQRQSDAAYPDAQRRMQEANDSHAGAMRALAGRASEWRDLQREHAVSAMEFPDMAEPDSTPDLEEARWQIGGLWHDETTNALRSALFAAALTLHEAWLAEVLQPRGGFGGNVVAFRHLLSGKRLLQREHAQLLWQSLFMVVPVISSTFASIASQFRDLGPSSLGWLFIDEAGQAVPQAAVGALWRARRAVVVGDPLQIEPVFTVPIKLIQALARAAVLPPMPPVEPHLASVQTLADEANGAGAWVEAHGTSKWIGSPLRVHRRCGDPMFTIANYIAYQDKMIFFSQDKPELRLPPADSLDVGPSAWVDIGGMARNRQVVTEQVELVRQGVMSLYRRTGELPALYIISPFRRVKEALIRALSKVSDWPEDARPAALPLREWCRTRIGTVHTFQGKEESMVWMVLGCDAATGGAAAWAASKPNLFNVALTRAKHRFFLIGEVGLWARLPHFSAASPTLLPRIRPEVFLQRVRTGTGE